MIKPQIPTGFWELDPQRQNQFKRLLQIIENIYEASNFNPIETPTMEYKEILLAKSQVAKVYRAEKPQKGRL